MNVLNIINVLIMIQAHFGDIRKIIIENIQKAKFNVDVAVAWVTDGQILDMLVKKLIEGVDVKIILVPDDINKLNGFDYRFFFNTGGVVFWDNHHHKFCIIDRKTVITGSYNWTYAANNRVTRENILLISGEFELIDKYVNEFKLLTIQAERYMPPPDVKVVIKEKKIIKYVDRPVEKIIEKPVYEIIEKPVKQVIEKVVVKPIEMVEKVPITVYTIYEKKGQYICGKCHSNKIVINPKAPKKIKNVVGFYCDFCNTYFDKGKNSISI